MHVWPCVHARTQAAHPTDSSQQDVQAAISSPDTHTRRSIRLQGGGRGSPGPASASDASHRSRLFPRFRPAGCKSGSLTLPRVRLMSQAEWLTGLKESYSVLGRWFVRKDVKRETRDEVPRGERLSWSVGPARWPASRPSGFSRGLHWVALTGSVLGHWTQTQPPAPGPPRKSGWA